MAKLAFTKLGLKTTNEIKTVEFNGQNIEVKQYLSTDEKLELIATIINNSADENNFANPVKIDVYFTIGMIENYTNITFTDKQKENISKLYDIIISNKLKDVIINTIPTDELNMLTNALTDTVEAVYKYRNSIMGVLELVKSDYDTTQFDLTNRKNEISDMENF
jgi:hypothetical protein